MAETLAPDICVIGAGSAGLTVAAAAAAFGAETVLIEKGRMGGDCLNSGCVPSKALIAAARRAGHAVGSADFGITVPAGVAVDFARVMAHVRDVIAGIAPHDSVERFERLGVRVIRAAAAFSGPETVSAGGFSIRARRFVIATGSRPAIPLIPGLDTVPFLTNETVFDLTTCPEHLLVMGGGPVGLEFAQAFRRLGARVTVIEAAAALGREDRELAEIALAGLRSDGIEILEQAKVTAVSGAPGAITLAASGPGGERVVAGSHLLVAVGRKATIDGLGLEAAGVASTARGITVNRGLRTSNPRVYAIGDVAGGPQFTHVAGHQAGLVVRSALFRLPVRETPESYPRVTYTAPEIGFVGLDEATARERHGDRVTVLRAPFSENDRARSERETAGLVKLVVGPRGRLLGAGVAGAAAGEIVALLSFALARKARVADLLGFVAPYPTFSEAVRRAALGYYAASAHNPWLRRLVRTLARFG